MRLSQPSCVTARRHRLHHKRLRESMIRDAMFRDYSCVLLEDCTAEPIGQQFERSNHEASVLLIQMMFGWISNSQELIKAINGERADATKERAAGPVHVSTVNREQPV